MWWADSVRVILLEQAPDTVTSTLILKQYNALGIESTITERSLQHFPLMPYC